MRSSSCSIGREQLAPIETSSGGDLPYFQRLDFIAPRTDIVAAWNSYEAAVRVLEDNNPTEGATITSRQ